jgi:UTP--glucose-1-phosphate uridylyltransferase
MTKKIRKAIIPAAGYGTRFLPATKASPKEMLPVVDKPIIQYVVEDAVSAGIEDIIIVTGWQKRSIEDHFDYPFELEKRLEESGKFEQLEEIRSIANLANFYYIRQKGPLGNATPIWNAKHFIGDEPFLVLWGDDFFYGSPTRCQQLVEAYTKHSDAAAILGSMRTKNAEDYKRYGFAAGKEVEDGLLKINSVVEKPGVGMIDSDFAVVSGALYSPVIFDAIEESMERLAQDNTPRELVYLDAVNILLEQKHPAYALEIKNSRFYDCGNKLEYLKAMVEFGLRHEDLKGEFGEYLKQLKQ